MADIRVGFNSMMLPKWLPFEQREAFAQQVEKCIDRYFTRWGKWPGYQARAHILHGLYTVFKMGRLGNSKWGYHLGQVKAGKGRQRQRHAQGLTNKMVSDIGNAALAKKRANAAYEAELAKAEERRRERKCRLLKGQLAQRF